jgi:hypothetical protein
MSSGFTNIPSPAKGSRKVLGGVFFATKAAPSISGSLGNSTGYSPKQVAGIFTIDPIDNLFYREIIIIEHFVKKVCGGKSHKNITSFWITCTDILYRF